MSFVVVACPWYLVACRYVATFIFRNNEVCLNKELSLKPAKLLFTCYSAGMPMFIKKI